MKERIKELKKQATVTHYHGLGEIDELNVEKFAELLIRDVVATIKRTQNLSPDFEWSTLNNYDLELEDE